ncbi:AAA family ATPase [Marinomonas mediterranea]|uniref:AAA family ATPase n=1 Tax=Marinomonas mediterranea TaxID=119864 RepID=UPI002349642B|nr:AAA family ATPase [Marinomonas mediterranea]WCN10707.1 AAA family ATPase [Marinomonas mediterranea]WCN14764.1 AAA family ATPase [Marinomonas mediterranea]
MKLTKLTVDNFRCYKERSFLFHPEFNLVVGQNATGKTALLDATATAVATWLLGFSIRHDRKPIEASDATLSYVEQSGESQFVESWPVNVIANGELNGKQVSWQRSKHSKGGNTRYGDASELRDIARLSNDSLSEEIPLPLISYYGTMRLWQDPKKSKEQVSKAKPSLNKHSKPSRLDGYKHCVDPRIALKELVTWFAKQEWQSFQLGKEPTMLKVVREAILGCIDQATSLRYDPKREELLLTLEKGEPQPFSTLSDGQRCILALVADLAQKAATLNPHMGEGVLQKTEGVVLIDELDLHLHPRWQRRVIEDLRTTFPNIQFICTTHSPFLIQSLRSNEELIMLDGESIANPANKTIEEIAADIMNINSPEVSSRYSEMKSVAGEYMKNLLDAEKAPAEKLEDYKNRLAEAIAPYDDNPAFQAFLEMQRIAKLGS